LESDQTMIGHGLTPIFHLQPTNEF